MYQNIYSESWEKRLEQQFFDKGPERKRAYICSPLSASDEKEMQNNILLARAYMLYAFERMGYQARAPHAYLPLLLDDRIIAERALALQFGIQLLEQSDILFVCGRRISTGMRGEIEHAAQLRMPIVTFHEDTFHEVRQLVLLKNSNLVRTVTLDQEHFIMGFTDPMAYMASLEGMA